MPPRDGLWHNHDEHHKAKTAEEGADSQWANKGSLVKELVVRCSPGVASEEP